MDRRAILNLPSMPAASPSYPKGPYRFINREYFIIIYESDPAAIRAAVPEPIEPAKENLVYYEWIRMPDSSGFGDYTESGVVIPCTFKGQACNFVAQMYLDDEPPVSAGREIWGFPKKYAHPKLETHEDTLTGTLAYAGQQVALGTMAYKHEVFARDPSKTIAALSKLQINLKLIPDVDGTPAIAQLVAYNLIDITVKGSWSGPARLHLIPHVNAPAADLPVRRIIGARHFIADLTLPYGRVVHDYLKEAGAAKPAEKRKR
ncbi:MAG: acetoacetate decarboxylase [Alphaproteobacteria bacterium]|nr:acetoacetate decarboxylase [Alphaproteobacteria bacterium]